MPHARPTVPSPDEARPGAFCWLDLAAIDADVARRFYAQAFGWTFVEARANGGRFTRCFAGDTEVATLYQLPRAQVESGAPSHWTPYVKVESADAAARLAARAGGRLLVAPFDLADTARIALLQDAAGALVGVWECLPRGAVDAGANDAA